MRAICYFCFYFRSISHFRLVCYAMIKLWSNLIFSHRKMRRGFLFFSALEATRCIFPFMKASAGVSVSVKRGVETYTVFKNPWKCLIGMKLSFDQKWDFSWWFSNCMGSSFLFEVEPVWKWNCHTCWRLCHVQDEITWERERAQKNGNLKDSWIAKRTEKCIFSVSFHSCDRKNEWYSMRNISDKIWDSLEKICTSVTCSSLISK